MNAMGHAMRAVRSRLVGAGATLATATLATTLLATTFLAATLLTTGLLATTLLAGTNSEPADPAAAFESPAARPLLIVKSRPAGKRPAPSRRPRPPTPNSSAASISIWSASSRRSASLATSWKTRAPTNGRSWSTGSSTLPAIRCILPACSCAVGSRGDERFSNAAVGPAAGSVAAETRGRERRL